MGIAHELKQTRPFASPSQEAAVALLRTADLLRRAIAATVEAAGITPQQYNVLRILRGAGPGGLPTLEIAERMIEQTPGITRLVDRLEERALVSRERCRTDRRQVFCRITEEGIALLARLDAPIRTTQDRTLGALGERRVQQLIQLLDGARTAIAASLAPPEHSTDTTAPYQRAPQKDRRKSQ